MAELPITETTLQNGLRLVTIDLPSFHSITNFLVIRSGSRYVTNDNNGIAHFLEHMVFKGTEKYPDTLAIARAIEGIGGYFNAWTANDHTAYWNAVPSSEWATGIEVVTELAYKALLPEDDLERERGVIIEEIRMIQDDPARYVDDLSESLIYQGHPLGQMIIGSERTIQAMTIKQFHDYRTTHYTPADSVYVVVGDIKGKDYVSALEAKLGSAPTTSTIKPQPFTGVSQRRIQVLNKNTDQTHFIIGIASPDLGLESQNQFVLAVLNTVLGSGMSSRLFLNIREKKGLAYAIYSSLNQFEETGHLSIYGGVNTGKVTQALAAVQEELERMSQEKVDEEELSKAKAQVTGAYDLSSDRPIDLARWHGLRRLLAQPLSFEQAKTAIEAVTAEQIQQAAQTLFKKDQQTLAVIGPFPSAEPFQKF